MTRYYELVPEVAGHLGEDTVLDTSVHPPLVSYLEYEFDGWLGDDILHTFPCYIVTKRLESALVKMKASGCAFDEVSVTRSEIFEQLQPTVVLPEFSWLKVLGRPGVDDFGMSTEHQLIVSEMVLDTLKSFALNYCDVSPYALPSEDS